MNIPATMLLILSFFVKPLLYSRYHHVHVLSPISFVFLMELSDPYNKSLHVLSLIFVLFLCRVFPPWKNFSICFFLLSMISYFVFDHVSFPQPFYLKTKHQSLPNVKIYLQILLLFSLLTPCKIAIIIGHQSVALKFLRHILYRSQMPLILLPILVFSMSCLCVILFLD